MNKVRPKISAYFPSIRSALGRAWHALNGAGWAACWLVLATPLAALNPDRNASSYSIQGWFTENGLPSNKVRAVTQTRDGYLWLATAQGIARFDGSRFTDFTSATNPELRGGGFFAVLEAPDGTLWFGGDNGLFRWRNGRFDRFTTEQGLAHNYVRALALTRDGAVVVCTRTGYSFLRDGHITTPGGVWKQITGVTRSFLERADGSYLLGTEDGLWRIVGDTIEKLSGTADLAGSGFTGLVESADGTLWIGYSLGVRGVHPDGKIENYGADQGLTTARIGTLGLDHDGNLWIGTYSALYRLAHGRIEVANYYERGNLAVVQRVCEDREGGLWIASAIGLFHLKDNVSGIGPEEGLAQTPVYTVFEAHDGVWWIGLWSGGVYHYDHGRATRLVAPESLGLDQVLSFAEEPAGTLWIGTNVGLFRRTEDTITNLYRPEQAVAWRKQLGAKPDSVLLGIAHSRVNSIAADGEGGLWVATDGALYHGNEGHFRALTTADGLPGNIFKTVLRARNGDVWVTAPPAGVARLRDGKWTNYLCGVEISAIYPRALTEDSAGSIWITTEGGGINRFKDGRWRTFTAADGLADDFISAFLEDKLGNFWIACPPGIMRIPQTQFAELDSGRRTVLQPRVFNRFDGLPGGEMNQQGAPNAWRTREGKLLFATDRGVAVVEPENVTMNQLKPPVYLERLIINGTAADLSRPVVVPPGANDVEIHYTAISLLAPEKVRFKIRLAPLDGDWVDVGARRDVRYVRLPPGDYDFHVRACNNDGVWNEEGRTLAFTVRPFFYQTAWFVGFVLAGAFAVAFGIHWTRIRLARRQLAVLAGLVKERTSDLQTAKEAAEAAEENAAGERARFKFIFDSVPVGIAWSAPGEESLHLVNPAHERITGVSAAEALAPGASARASHPDDDRRQQALTQKFVQGEINHYSIEKRFLRAGGGIVWAVLTSRMFVDPVTGKKQSVTTLVDITDLKRAEEETARQQARFKFIFDAVPVGLTWMVRDQLATRIVNPAHALLTGVPVERCRELELYRLATHPDDRIGQDAAHQRLVAGEVERYELEKRYVLADGSVCWTALSVNFYREQGSGETHEICTLVDITARKAAEQELTNTYKRLLDVSRQAGMAEVATGVLHNVGNVLNSVNVSATLVADHLRRSKAGNVAKLAGLIDEHKADLAVFLTQDPRGRMIPEFLATLKESLAEEQKTMTAELDHLRKNIEHIKEIVAMQQSYAKASGLTETIPVVDMIEDALRISAGSLDRNEVDAIRDYQVRPVVDTDKHKVMQILINLVRNARYACDECGRADGRITVRITGGKRSVKIAIVDNGIGIPAGDLTRIFNHGFTTRKDGHGFGLHSGALAAKELGGSLTVHSDGPGKGAIFTLELPNGAGEEAA